MVVVGVVVVVVVVGVVVVVVVVGVVVVGVVVVGVVFFAFPAIVTMVAIIAHLCESLSVDTQQHKHCAACPCQLPSLAT